jgi:hypothetical protein
MLKHRPSCGDRSGIVIIGIAGIHAMNKYERHTQSPCPAVKINNHTLSCHNCQVAGSASQQRRLAAFVRAATAGQSAVLLSLEIAATIWRGHIATVAPGFRMAQ